MRCCALWSIFSQPAEPRQLQDLLNGG